MTQQTNSRRSVKTSGQSLGREEAYSTYQGYEQGGEEGGGLPLPVDA